MPVDETRPIPYLCMTMTRHFFALLALLTGLAALGSPAQASMTSSLAEALACNASIAAAGEEVSGSESAAAQPAPATLRATRAVEAPARRPAAPAALRLPVLMGIERAYE
jgi:hypothetical protein